MSVDGVFDVIQAFDPIDLDQLAATADLQTRADRKYLVPRHYVERVVARLDGRALEIDGARAFAYESVYFDTPDLVSYLGAARRRPRRFKVRTRAYVGSRDCMLEVKVRDARGRTVKHRFPHPFDQRRELTADARDFVRSVDVAAPSADQLHGALTTTYRRATLVLRGTPARITVDLNAAFRSVDGRSVHLDDLAWIETKTPGPPCPADRLLWRDRYRPAIVSKYCTGLAALEPDLPSNKWHRVLLTHFVDARYSATGGE